MSQFIVTVECPLIGVIRKKALPKRFEQFSDAVLHIIYRFEKQFFADLPKIYPVVACI